MKILIICIKCIMILFLSSSLLIATNDAVSVQKDYLLGNDFKKDQFAYLRGYGAMSVFFSGLCVYRKIIPRGLLLLMQMMQKKNLASKPSIVWCAESSLLVGSLKSSLEGFLINASQKDDENLDELNEKIFGKVVSDFIKKNC